MKTNLTICLKSKSLKTRYINISGNHEHNRAQLIIFRYQLLQGY